MRSKDIFEGSSWGKISRRAPARVSGYGDSNRGLSLSRVGDIPKGLVKLAQAYGAYYDEENRGWYVKGKIPHELKDAIRAYRK